MKIVFICGCLKPGRDGVGDYTRRLAAELIRQGHQAAALALNDRHISEEFKGTQDAEGINLPVLCVPTAWTEKKRFRHAEKWIKSIDPEWLSLQFVPFSFHRKGLPFKLSSQLVKLGVGRHWHIMFHELWVGMEKGASVKNVCWGWMQQRLIHSLIINLKPAVIHTQTRLYQAQLVKLGFNAEYLPLFGNISPNSRANINAGKVQTLAEIRKIISLVIFGTIHPSELVDQFAKEASLYAKEKGVQISLTMVGRCGKEQEQWAAAWKSEGLVVKLLGEQSPERISEVLGNASIGISTNPIALVEKSGTIAAMREYGLPVLCVKRPWQARGMKSLEPPLGIVEYRNGNLEACFASKLNFPPINKVSEVSRQLAEALLTTV